MITNFDWSLDLPYRSGGSQKIKILKSWKSESISSMKVTRDANNGYRALHAHDGVMDVDLNWERKHMILNY